MPRPTDDFRKDDHGLLPVQVTLWNGFLFLCLADEPPDFRPDLGRSGAGQLADGRPGHRPPLETVLACNWKIFWENYNECLHCPGIHPELCDMVPVYRQGHHVARPRRRTGRRIPPPVRP